MKNLGKIDRVGGGGRWNRHRIYSQRRKNRAYIGRWILIVAAVLAIAFTIGFAIYNTKKISGKNEESPKKVSKESTAKEEKKKPDKIEGKIQATIDSMTLEEKVAQLFVITPETLTETGVVIQAGEKTKECLQSYPVGGLIYSSQNIISEEQLKTMLTTTKAMSKYPVFLGIEEEGGSSMAPIANSGVINVTKFSDMSEIGTSKDSEKAKEVGTEIGAYLSELGFNLDFAPVANVFSDSTDTVMATRSFGTDAKDVSLMVREVVKGMQKSGVSGTIKYFPGDGSELSPFESGIEAGVDLIMVGNVSIPAIAGEDIPSSVSEKVISELLRKKLKYDGIVITQAMNTEEITQKYDSIDIGIKVIQAGGDIILMPEDFKTAYTGLLNAVLAGTISEERIDESLTRIFRVKMAE